MNENDFEREIKWMERELLALKTDHERGLGVFDFYQETVEYTAEALSPSVFPLRYFYVAVTVADGEPTPPFVQLSVDPRLKEPLKVVSSNDGKTLTYTFFDNYPFVEITYKIIAISGSKIASMVITEGDTE